ncbi:hypothetical protein [Maliponia aquimaris]|uniref:Uncharacterized protein n=1 Tax=Maliponia aquimaris TaxID=1673631 RepID=A0A238KHS9_9RHOB|nr:hypothetical protein [Maliponia aquimaris]SMX42409.1 hypothetical protein MAA8898_02598 [Maliponia aquimaris]
MPRLVRLFVIQSLIGAGVATVFVALLLALDVANLWYLVTHTRGGVLAAIVLWVHFAAVFAGVQFAISVMRLADVEGDREGPRGGPPEPVRVEALGRLPIIGRKRASGRPD